MLAGALGVVLPRNPVHSALSLVLTLFGVAVLFVAQDAHFLAAVQVIVYAGAIVVLFLFVIMLLGVDRAEDLETEPLARPAAAAPSWPALACSAWSLVASWSSAATVTGARGPSAARRSGDGANVEQLGRSLFTDYVFAFEITVGAAHDRRGRRGRAGPPPHAASDVADRAPSRRCRRRAR